MENLKWIFYINDILTIYRIVWVCEWVLQRFSNTFSSTELQSSNREQSFSDVNSMQRWSLWMYSLRLHRRFINKETPWIYLHKPCNGRWEVAPWNNNLGTICFPWGQPNLDKLFWKMVLWARRQICAFLLDIWI